MCSRPKSENNEPCFVHQSESVDEATPKANCVIQANAAVFMALVPASHLTRAIARVGRDIQANAAQSLRVLLSLFQIAATSTWLCFCVLPRTFVRDMSHVSVDTTEVSRKTCKLNVCCFQPQWCRPHWNSAPLSCHLKMSHFRLQKRSLPFT